VRERIADVLALVAHRRERVVLTRHGREVGAIVPLEDLERLRALDARPAEEPSPTLAAYRISWRRVTESLHRRN
jgi:prevent-host-death family protein